MKKYFHNKVFNLSTHFLIHTETKNSLQWKIHKADIAPESHGYFWCVTLGILLWYILLFCYSKSTLYDSDLTEQERENSNILGC